ncbi:hypothetical protein [Microvirga sp. 2TAF3]|uniref:hypothetical protein n=1 Tax=Microvirga sp. 2TAF3 TaxID=3233014 RepID=UPI003F9D080A
MRILAALSALLLFGTTLAGCSTGAPQGVLPRTAVPPPPSLGGTAMRQTAASERVDPAIQRRAIDVPAKLETSRPSSPRTMEPVLTGSGVGAGFRF